eukprot:3341160-Pleurochrysis_carterae.AAC.3
MSAIHKYRPETSEYARKQKKSQLGPHANAARLSVNRIERVSPAQARPPCHGTGIPRMTAKSYRSAGPQYSIWTQAVSDADHCIPPRLSHAPHRHCDSRRTRLDSHVQHDPQLRISITGSSLVDLIVHNPGLQSA